MIYFFCIPLFFIILLAGVYIWKRKIHIWLPAYTVQIAGRILKFSRVSEPMHVMFCLVDHFEPGWNRADLDLQRKRVDGWHKLYPQFANRFTDADGCHPRHTWFYPPHYFREEHILKLISLCVSGFGEIEMHLHHNRMPPFPDTSETLRNKILSCIDLYSKFGIFKTRINGKPVVRYAFIHGDWALDNSREGYCGVNDEITILKETGCYADFTFPSYMMESQPETINSIYYAVDDPDKSKSYNRGRKVRAGGNGQNGSSLLMVQGPLGLRWKGRRRLFMPSVDDGEIASNNRPSKERVDFWVKTGIHVSGRPDWIFIKAFTHGAPCREHKVLLGRHIQDMHAYLAEKYNDGKHYCLHYVTAREVFNIIMAAENGCQGNPSQYRDYIQEPYTYYAPGR